MPHFSLVIASGGYACHTPISLRKSCTCTDPPRFPTIWRSNCTRKVSRREQYHESKQPGNRDTEPANARDRRREPRFKTSQPVVLTVMGTKIKPVMEGCILNISDRGLRVRDPGRDPLRHGNQSRRRSNGCSAKCSAASRLTGLTMSGFNYSFPFRDPELNPSKPAAAAKWRGDKRPGLSRARQEIAFPLAATAGLDG